MRSAEGTVPRHSEVTGCGDERMERRTGNKEEERDCWTRVLRRSAGWSRTAEETPEARPARKWKVGWEDWRFGEAVDVPLDISELVDVTARKKGGVGAGLESPAPS